MAELAILADQQRTSDPQSDYPSSQQFGAGQGKFAGRNQRSTHSATPPTGYKWIQVDTNCIPGYVYPGVNAVLDDTLIIRSTHFLLVADFEDNYRNVSFQATSQLPGVPQLSWIRSPVTVHSDDCVMFQPLAPSLGCDVGGEPVDGVTLMGGA